MKVVFKQINIHLLIFWILLTSIMPFIFLHWPGHPHKLLFLGVMLVICLILVYRNNLKANIYPIIANIILLLYYFFANIYYGNPTLTMQLQCVSYFIMYLYLYNFVGIKDFVKSFIIIIILMGVGGTVILFLHLLVGVNSLFAVDYSEHHTSHFLWLTTTNIYYNLDGLRFMRYSGFFDEPGAYGLYAMYAILLNKLYFDNKKYEKLLIILPLFCFSMAFYLFIVLYILLLYFKRVHFKYFWLSLILLITLITVISNLDRSDPGNLKIYQFTVGRFVINDEGELAGNSRRGYKEIALDIFVKNPFFGDGISSGSSIHFLFAQYGLIGAFWSNIHWIVYFLLILQYSSGSNKVLHLKILFLILISYYHRPGLNPLIVVLSFCFMHSIIDSRNLKVMLGCK